MRKGKDAKRRKKRNGGSVSLSTQTRQKASRPTQCVDGASSSSMRGGPITTESLLSTSFDCILGISGLKSWRFGRDDSGGLPMQPARRLLRLEKQRSTFSASVLPRSGPVSSCRGINVDDLVYFLFDVTTSCYAAEIRDRPVGYHQLHMGYGLGLDPSIPGSRRISCFSLCIGCSYSFSTTRLVLTLKGMTLEVQS